MKQSIDLDYDSDLDGDAEGFGISNTTITKAPAIAHPPGGQCLVAPAHVIPNDSLIGTEGAVRLAMEVCQWEFTFYSWASEYLSGVRGEALLDIPLVRYKLMHVRNYWGPKHFAKGEALARTRYYAIMAAQAALSAVERKNKLPLIQKVIYYTGMVEKYGGM